MLIDRGNVRAGETVLVNSASSGVSMAAIQICKLAGAYVYTTSSADWKLERAKELGADEVINYNEVDFTDEILRRTDKRGVDLVVEHVGGDFLDKSIRCLTRGGRVVTVGGTKSYDCKILVNYVFHKELQLIGSNSATKHDLEVMMPLLGNGKLKTVIDRVFPLQEAAEAHRYLEAAKQFGKVILRVDH
jgi:NADPH:quinone reductase-like Zn-dependent oxidoreductase